MAELTTRSGWMSTRRLRRVRRGIAVAAAASLTACTYLEDLESLLNPPPPVEETVTIVLPEPEAEPVEPVAPPATRRPRPPAQSPQRTARLPPPPERPASQPLPGPEIKLVGVSREQAETLLGSPAEQREAAPAKIWQYRAGDCVVDVYFYLDVARNDFFALHYDVRSESAAVGGEAAERCLQRIYSEKHK
jgi:hypothetical protein